MKTLILVYFSLTIMGCATYQPPRNYNFNSERVVANNYDKVWQNAIEWFAEHNTPIKNMDKSSGFLSTEYSLDAYNSTDCFDCGKPGGNLLATQKLEEPTGNFNVVIKRLDDTTTNVKITCFFNVISRIYMEGRVQDTKKLKCKSTGIMEESFLEHVTGKSSYIEKEKNNLPTPEKSVGKS